MRGVVSFHPVDPEFFNGLIESLVAGEKVNPESFLEGARRNRTAAWLCRRYKLAFELLLEQLAPPPPPEVGTMWEKVRARLERFDHRPERLVRVAAAKIDPELHLQGRPFLITEGSAEGVTRMVGEYLDCDGEKKVAALALEQLVRLDPQIAQELQPESIEELSADARYRTELLDRLKQLFQLGNAARSGEMFGTVGDREPATEVLARELPWRAAELHSRAVPFWIARDVDGLEPICQATGIEPPSCLVPAWRLFARSCENFPGLREALDTDLKSDRDVGAFVPPDDVPELLAFLNDHGARIIKAATQHEEGRTCSTLLRKIRECARFAERCGVGYLEASGIHPVAEEPAEVEESAHA